MKKNGPKIIRNINWHGSEQIGLKRTKNEFKTNIQFFFIFSGFEQSHLARRSPPPALNAMSARQRQRARHAKIDRFFLVFFPLLFLIFNFVYWLAYYYAHPVLEILAEQQAWAWYEQWLSAELSSEDWHRFDRYKNTGERSLIDNSGFDENTHTNVLL